MPIFSVGQRVRPERPAASRNPSRACCSMNWCSGATRATESASSGERLSLGATWSGVDRAVAREAWPHRAAGRVSRDLERRDCAGACSAGAVVGAWLRQDHARRSSLGRRCAG